MLEDGAYTRLLDQYYSRESPLPKDKAQLYRIARTTSAAERKAVDSVLAQFFTLGPDGWRQKRADIELEEQRQRSESARQSAKRMWSERNANAYANAMPTHMPTQSERNANAYANAMLASSQKPVTSNQGVKRVARARSTPPTKTPLPEGFGISERVGKWATEHGYDRLQERLDQFIGKARANGYRYVDWDEAFMGAIRDDWAKLTGKAAPGSGLTANGQQTATSLNRWLTEEPHDGTTGP